MSQTFEAVYDGTVLRPNEPVALEANTRVRVTIEEAVSGEDKLRSFLRTARSLHLSGPQDWSANLDQYLYGQDPSRDA